ncbi:MAG: hypothetical protein L6408_02265 [Nanoarchaeota archaeon]|nr:hypothetical protein [Nanoarchaeota archaeon]
MKLPKSFRPGKDLDGKIHSVLNNNKHKPSSVKSLLEAGHLYMLENPSMNLLSSMYDIGVKVSKDLTYNKYDLDEYSRRLKQDKGWRSRYLGIYISSLINNLIAKDGEDLIVISPNIDLYAVGIYLKKGNVIVNSDVGDKAGFMMKGGGLIIKGDVGDFAGCLMEGGELSVYGDIGKKFGDAGKGGVIYHYDDKIWPAEE